MLNLDEIDSAKASVLQTKRKRADASLVQLRFAWRLQLSCLNRNRRGK